jgi:hypothetical protein
VLNGIVDTTDRAEAVSVSPNPEGSLVSVNSAGEELDKEASVGRVGLVIEPLKSDSMDASGPFSCGLQMSEPLCVPDVVEKGLENGLSGGVKVERTSVRPHPDGGSPDLEAVGEHAFATPIQRAASAVGWLIKPPADG